MTAYANFIKDYPDRCKRLLDKNFIKAGLNNLEVTLLLSICSSGLIIPYERLKDSSHIAKDSNRFKSAKTKFDQLLKLPFIHSDLWDSTDEITWRFCKKHDFQGDPDSWEIDDWDPIGAETKVEQVIKTMRNALAHGNIFIRGKQHIDLIIFLSRIVPNDPDKGHRCLTVSPAHLHKCILNWFNFISRIDILGDTIV